MAPFDLLDPEPPGLLNRTPDRNAYVELHNLVAAAQHVYEFGPDDTVRIAREHDVDLLGDAFAAERGALYVDFLRHRLADGALTPEERDEAAHLARTLFLARGDLRRLHARVFGHTVAQVIADDCLDADEQLLLFTLQHTLGLDPDDAEASYERAARERLLQRIAHALCDGELDPDEAAEIRAMEIDLGVAVPERVEAMLATAAERWQLLRGPLQPLDAESPVALRDGEAVYWVSPGHWTEAPKPVGRSGSRMPFMQRASLRPLIAKLRKRRDTHAGRLTLTNERLLLARYRTTGSKDVRTVALRKVAEATPSEGFVLLRRDGKIDWLLRLDDEAPTFAAVATRLIADRTARRAARAQRDRDRRREEEQRWKRGERLSGDARNGEVQAKLRAADAHAARLRARIAEREKARREDADLQAEADLLPRYRGPLLFRPDRGEMVYLAAPARWNADEAVRRAVKADPTVPNDTIEIQRAVLDRQREARGEGTLYLTNKRLLLIDPRGDTVLFPIRTISGAVLRDDRVEVERHGQMGRVLFMSHPMEFARLLERLVRDAR